APAEISFRILSPVWQRWWFIAAIIILFGGIAVAFYRGRIARLVAAREAEEKLSRSRQDRLIELDRVRSRIATDLHDDIGSSLSQISLYSELARQREQKKNGVGESLDMITHVADDLVDTMSDIVWAINPKKDHLNDLIQRMRRFAADTLSA